MAEGRPSWIEIGATALVGYLVFTGLRAGCLERYLVPSPSMEPTLHGDPEAGDRVLVDKTAFWSRRPYLGEMVVLAPRKPGGNPVVKRLAAEGPATLALREGDLFVDVGDGRGLTRQLKDPRQAAAVRVVSHRFRAGDPQPDWLAAPTGDPLWSVDATGLTLRSAVPGGSDDWAEAIGAEARQARLDRRPDPDHLLPGHLSLAEDVDSSFLDATGSRIAASRHHPQDIGLRLRLRPEASCRSLHLVCEQRGRYLALEWQRDGGLWLRTMGATAPLQLGRDRPWPAAEEWSLLFGFLDGRLFALLEAENELLVWEELEIPPASDLRIRGAPLPTFVNNLHLAVDGGALRIGELEVFHDVFYPPLRDEPFELGPGELFVLGDNSLFSEDSRSLRESAGRGAFHYRVGDLIGRPIAILAPSGRRRWLPGPVTPAAPGDN